MTTPMSALRIPAPVEHIGVADAEAGGQHGPADGGADE
jgi:hypothetical protein